MAGLRRQDGLVIVYDEGVVLRSALGFCFISRVFYRDLGVGVDEGAREVTDAEGAAKALLGLS